MTSMHKNLNCSLLQFSEPISRRVNYASEPRLLHNSAADQLRIATGMFHRQRQQTSNHAYPLHTGKSCAKTKSHDASKAREKCCCDDAKVGPMKLHPCAPIKEVATSESPLGSVNTRKLKAPGKPSTDDQWTPMMTQRQTES